MKEGRRRGLLSLCFDDVPSEKKDKAKYRWDQRNKERKWRSLLLEDLKSQDPSRTYWGKEKRNPAPEKESVHAQTLATFSSATRFYQRNEMINQNHHYLLHWCRTTDIFTTWLLACSVSNFEANTHPCHPSSFNAITQTSTMNSRKDKLIDQTWLWPQNVKSSQINIIIIFILLIYLNILKNYL